jgi:Flp pilus assembly protein TadB
MPLVILGDLGIGPYIRVRKISSNGKVITIATVWGRNSVAFLLIVLAIMLAVIWVVTQRRKKRRSKYRTAI